MPALHAARVSARSRAACAASACRRCSRRRGGRCDARPAAVFLDRDGTIIEEVGYLDRVERVELYPWTIDADPRLQPRRPARSWSSRTSRASRAASSPRRSSTRCIAHIAALLAAGGARIDAYYYCPHHPDGKVAGYARRLRLPEAGRGLVDRAARELGLDPRALVRGRRPLARRRRWRARSARAAFWCGPATARRKKADDRADAVVHRRRASVRQPDRRAAELDSDVEVEVEVDMLIARSVHPLPGEAERKERLLALVDGFCEPPRARRRRPDRRRVHLRRGRARLARGAGADPEVRRDRDGRRRRRQRRQQRRGARRPRASGRARRRRRRGPPAAGELSPRRRSRRTSSAPRGTGRRSRRASSPAASTPRSSRSCASIARPAGRSPQTVSRAFATKVAPALGDCDAVLLSDYGSGLVTPRARRRRSARPWRSATRRRADAGARRFALPAARLSRPDDLHAERIGSRSRCSASASTTTRRRSSAPGRAAAAAHRACRRCSSRAAAAAWRSSSRSSRPCTCRSSAPTRSTDVTGAGDTVIADVRPRARGRRVVLRSGAPRQLRRRPRRHEARHGDRLRARAVATRSTSDHDTSLENWSQEGPPQGRRQNSELRT